MPQSPFPLPTLIPVAILAGALLAVCALPIPAGPVVEISGPIVDAVTGAPVVADVLVDGVVKQRQTTQLSLTLPLHTWQTEIRVVAPGYQIWAIAVQGKESRKLAGPVRLARSSPSPPGEPG